MTTLYHPNLRDTAIEVEDDKVESYVAQGWRKTEPKKFKASASTSTSTATNNSSASGEDNKKEG